MKQRKSKVMKTICPKCKQDATFHESVLITVSNYYKRPMYWDDGEWEADYNEDEFDIGDDASADSCGIFCDKCGAEVNLDDIIVEEWEEDYAKET